MTKRRPALVLETLLREKKYFVIKVVPIKLGPQAPGSIVVRLTNKGSATDACSVPGWPLDDAFCYVFPHPESFVSVAEVFPFILQSFFIMFDLPVRQRQYPYIGE
jgi:casein kinase I family protein HRR25